MAAFIEKWNFIVSIATGLIAILGFFSVSFQLIELFPTLIELFCPQLIFGISL